MSKRVFLSLGMSGKPEEEVRAKIKRMTEDLLLFDKDIEVIHNYDMRGSEEDGRLYYLGAAIQKMDKVDFMYLEQDWENKKGCIIEEHVARLYNIPIIHEKFLRKYIREV